MGFAVVSEKEWSVSGRRDRKVGRVPLSVVKTEQNQADLNQSKSIQLFSPSLVASGVPQGSVLGPLLFNLFVNDVTDHLDPSATAKLFADDIKLYTSFSNISPSILQSQLNIIHTWSTLWQLRISHPKCSILNIGPHQQNNSFQIDQNKIKDVDHVCDLGVTIDSTLKFKIHINAIVSKASQRKSLSSDVSYLEIHSTWSELSRPM